MMESVLAVAIFVAGLAAGVWLSYQALKVGLRIGEARRLDEELGTLEEPQSIEQEETV